MSPDPTTAHLTVQKLDEKTSRRGRHRIVSMRAVGGLNPAGARPPARGLPVFAGGGVPRAGVLLRAEDHTRLDVILFSVALGLYLLSRFIGLLQYPVYFHGDEAIHTVLASELIRDGGMFEHDTFLPPYFKNGPKYNLSLSVYLQILPTWLFGKSVIVTRGTSILLTLIPAAAVSLIVRDFLKLPYSWTATLLLSLVPAWFLHSRTAFETVLSVSMYAGFLYYYLRYRLEHPKYLYAALLFGALTFYAYSPAQLIIVACGFFLFLFDFRYHLKHWRTGVGGLVWLALLTLPYIRFRLDVSAPIAEHLRDLGSYWLAPLSLTEKLSRFVSIYFYGLAPGYWYVPNGQDLIRHQMGPYPHILFITLPFALVGVGVALKTVVTTSVVGKRLKSLLRKTSVQVREAGNEANIALTYRTILLALLIAPLPGTLAQVGITRVLTFIFPITILTAVGFIAALRWVEMWTAARVAARHLNLRLTLVPTTFAVLGLGLGFFTFNAIRSGPFWTQDYGFGGMQYGAQQLFDRINDYLEGDNHRQIVLSPDWANGSDELADFFLDDPFAIQMASIESYLITKQPLDLMELLILTPTEYTRAVESNKFKTVQVEDTIFYPDGTPGFYFVRLAYVDNIDEVLAEERAAQHALQEETMQWEGMRIVVRHSALDMGDIQAAFDNDDQSVIRTNRTNPFVLEMDLPEPRAFHGLSVNVGASIVRVTVQLFSEAGGDPLTFTQDVQAQMDAPVVMVDFGSAISAKMIRLEVLLLEDTEFGHVHLWEIRLLSD